MVKAWVRKAYLRPKVSNVKISTCISTIDPQCFAGSTTAGTDGVVPYFSQAVSLFKTLPTFDWLAEAGIVPSNTASYATSDILSVLKSKTGYEPYLGCSSGALNEVWYFYNVRGSLIDGDFQHTSIVGKTGTCGSSIRYLPKTSGADPTTTKAGTAPTSTGAFSGKGYLNVDKGGCLISTGKWYKSGTCATFTATPSSAGQNKFTLTSSKGNCALINTALTCASSVSAGYQFTSSGGYLGQSGYSADADISGSTQASVYDGAGHDLPLKITFST